MTERIVDVLGQWLLRPGPLHARLAAAIREAIERGALANGARLPAERALARMLAVSRSTVAAAYTSLAREGVLEGRQGSGTYVRARAVAPPPPPHPPTRIPRALAVGSFGVVGDTLELTSATVSGGVITPALAAEALADPAFRGGHGYVPLGIPSLRAAVAEHLGAAGLPTVPEQVLVTSGAQQALVLAASLLARRGDRVIVEHATFPGVLDAIAATGAKLVTAPLDGDGVRVEGLRAVAEEQGARAAFLVPTFHNPTGTVVPASRRQALANVSKELELVVVDDETMADLWLEERPPPPVAAYAADAPIFTVGSISKLAWGGLRVGWIRASEATIAQLVALKVVADLGSSVVSQAIAALLLPRAEELRVLRRKQIRAGLATLDSCLTEELPEWEYTLPRGGLALWVKLPFGDAEEFAQLALRHRVLVLPGTSASAGGEHRDRLRLPLLRDPEVLADGVHRLAAAWRAYEPALARGAPRISVIV
jgi:DNA-binding transcriptional MocR family regulator